MVRCMFIARISIGPCSMERAARVTKRQNVLVPLCGGCDAKFSTPNYQRIGRADEILKKKVSFLERLSLEGATDDLHSPGTNALSSRLCQRKTSSRVRHDENLHSLAARRCCFGSFATVSFERKSRKSKQICTIM